MYVCMCACMHACMHVCMYVCIYVCMYVSMYVCIYVSMYLCIYVCMYVCMGGWIFQKVLAEIVQKALISNRPNFGLFAPKSMRFPSKDSKSKNLPF